MENLGKMGEIGEEQRHRKINEPQRAPFILPIPEKIEVPIEVPEREKVRVR